MSYDERPFPSLEQVRLLLALTFPHILLRRIEIKLELQRALENLMEMTQLYPTKILSLATI